MTSYQNNFGLIACCIFILGCSHLSTPPNETLQQLQTCDGISIQSVPPALEHFVLSEFPGYHTAKTEWFGNNDLGCVQIPDFVELKRNLPPFFVIGDFDGNNFEDAVIMIAKQEKNHLLDSTPAIGGAFHVTIKMVTVFDFQTSPLVKNASTIYSSLRDTLDYAFRLTESIWYMAPGDYVKKNYGREDSSVAIPNDGMFYYNVGGVQGVYWNDTGWCYFVIM